MQRREESRHQQDQLGGSCSTEGSCPTQRCVYMEVIVFEYCYINLVDNAWFKCCYGNCGGDWVLFREVLSWCRPWRLSRRGCTNGQPFMNKSQAPMGMLSWSIFYVAIRIGMAVTNEFAGYECHTPQLCNRPVDQMAYMLWRCRRWWSIPNGAIPWIRLKDRNLRCIIGMRRCMNMREKGMSDSVTEQFQLTPTKSS